MKCVELLQRECDREGVKVCITHIIKRLFVSFIEIYIYHTFDLTKLSHNVRSGQASPTTEPSMWAEL